MVTYSTVFEVLDAARGPLFGSRRVVLAGPFDTYEEAHDEQSMWCGTTDPRVVERSTTPRTYHIVEVHS